MNETGYERIREDRLVFEQIDRELNYLDQKHFGSFRLIEELSCKNPYVRAVMSNWRNGHYPSLEMALIHAVVELARQNEVLTTKIKENLINQNPMITPPSSSPQ